MIGVSPNTGPRRQTHAPFVRSPAMRTAVERFQAALRTDAGVLIAGEAGTGRELMARAIHRASIDGVVGVEELLGESTRAFKSERRPFVIVDCAAPDVEGALFGTPPVITDGGDFDAISEESRLCRAVGGTLFLRQLHEMPTRHQVRLARVLRDGEAWVKNGHEPGVLAPVRARVIASIEASTGGDRHDHINHDLWKRFAGPAILLPPLRERREDIAGLVKQLLGDICAAMNIPRKSASKQVNALLSALPWPGNLRELRVLLRTVVIKVPGQLIRLTDVLEHVRLDGASVVASGGGTLKEARERFERDYVAAVLHQHRGRMADAAKVLGIQRTNLYRKVRQLAVQRTAGR